MKLRPFELVMIVVFGGLAALSLFILATYKPEPDPGVVLASQVGQITVWGTIPAAQINNLLVEKTEEIPVFKQITYKYVNPLELSVKLTEAISYERGPDLILASHENLAALRGRIYPFPYDKSTQLVDIRSKYLDGAQIFALSDGLYGYPIAIDPMVMYWNKDILTTEGYLEPPKTWEKLVNDMFPTLIQRDFDRTIRRSVVSMGEYTNVRNAFGKLSMLMLQGGTKGVTENGKEYSIQLSVSSHGAGNPIRSATDFYTRFSKSSNTQYSWNRSLPEDRSQFIAGDLVFYFGYASEAGEIERANPNLNFDIAEVPQGAEATVRRTYGKIYGLSVLKSSDNISGAAAVMSVLAGSAIAGEIATRNNLVPAYRAAVMAGSNDIYGRIAYKTAPITFGWLNPDRNATDEIFGTMIKDINENRRDVDGATGDALSKLKSNY